MLIVGKLSQTLSATKTFLTDVKTEMKKSSWPNRAELIESTVVIIISVSMLAAFVGVSDYLLVAVIRLMVRVA